MSLLAHLDIANAACAAIGEDPLESFSDDSFGGQQAQALYDATLVFNLGVYQFGFSKQIRQLSPNDSVVPMSGYSRVFDLPPEALGLPLYLTDRIDEPEHRFDRYALVGAQAQSNATTLYAMIRFRPEPYLWSPTFTGMQITALASKYAISMATDRALADQLHRIAYGAPQENYRGGQMGVAIAADSFSTPPRKVDWANRNPLLNARRGG